MQLHSGEAALDRSSWHLSDTMVQENFTTFPTDDKLCKKVVERCNKIAKKENITLRRSYTRESKQCFRDTYNGKHPKRAKKANKAHKRLKTIANVQFRDLERKMMENQRAFYEKDLTLFKHAVNQQKNDSPKFTAFTSLFIRCISKGKAISRMNLWAKWVSSPQEEKT